MSNPTEFLSYSSNFSEYVLQISRFTRFPSFIYRIKVNMYSLFLKTADSVSATNFRHAILKKPL